MRALNATDAGTVFNRLCERVVSVGSVKKLPKGINGLAIVAKHHPHYQLELVDLLATFDTKDLGIWVVKGWNESITDTSAREKLIEVMRGWVNQNDNTNLKKLATISIKTLQQGRT